MPKHIKISKHPDTRKFYVSDVCEFLSVEVQKKFYTNITFFRLIHDSAITQ